MAYTSVTPTTMYRGAASTTTTTTLYTVPANTTAIVTEIFITNTANAAGTYTIFLDGVAIANNVTIGAQDGTSIPMKQVLAAGKTITGGASATTVNIQISGVQIV